MIAVSPYALFHYFCSFFVLRCVLICLFRFKFYDFKNHFFGLDVTLKTDQLPTRTDRRPGEQQHPRPTESTQEDAREQHAEDRDGDEQPQEQARPATKRHLNKSHEQDFER